LGYILGAFSQTYPVTLIIALKGVGPVFRHERYEKDCGRNKTLLAQGCQMVYFKTKNPNLGKLLRVLKWNM
jgi:hypothetical protein